MDSGVLHDIDSYQPADSKVLDCIKEEPTSTSLAAVSYWDDIDNLASPDLLRSPQSFSASHTQSLTTSISGSDSAIDVSSRSSKHKTSKRPVSSKKRRCAEDKKPSNADQDLSALDCSDYWLRFDTDNESLYRGGESNEKDAAPAFSLSDLIQPYSRTTSVGSPGSFNLAFQSSRENSVDDSALDHALTDEEDFLSLALGEHPTTSESSPGTIDPPERLYSTPLSWEQPQPGLQMNSFMTMNTPFNDPERQRLLAIALGSGQPLQQQQQSVKPPVGMDFQFDFNQSPRMMSTAQIPDPRQRDSVPTRPRAVSRTTAPALLEKPKEKPRSSDRAAHNDIERKYRTNLKDRIAELRDAIPSLRSIPEDVDETGSPIASRSPVKASKGTVLSKATEYIHQLERRNRSMAQKNEELTRRLQAFEQLVGVGAPGPNWQPQTFTTTSFDPRGFA